MHSNYEKLNDEYRRLYRRHREMVWSMCYHHAAHDLDLARDLAQDVYVALWTDFENLRARGNLKMERAWVWWHTRTILSHHGRKREEQLLPQGYDIYDGEQQRLAEEREALEELMSVLRPGEQMVVRMRIEGYDYNEISEALDKTPEAVKQTMFRATKRMKQYYNKINNNQTQ